METDLLNNILKESVWVATLLFLCYSIIKWLAKRYEKAEDEKAEIAKEVIKLTVAYETKLDDDKASNHEIRAILLEIRDSIRKWEKME